MDKSTIVKLTARYLSENDYGVVADILQNESGTILYNDFYNNLISSIEKIDYPKAMSSLQELIKSRKNNHDSFYYMLILIYNSIFYCNVYHSYSLFDNKQLIEAIQSHMVNISSFYGNCKSGKSNKEHQEQFLNIQKASSSILFRKDPEYLVQLFPQILSINTLILYIKKLYYKDVFSHQNNLKQIVDKIYKYQFDNCTSHNRHQPLNEISYYTDHSCNKSKLIPNKIGLSIDTKQEVLNIVYSNTGRYFAAVLNNKNVNIYTISNSDKANGIEISETKSFSPHTNQITSLSWNKEDSLILTTSKDKTIKLLNPFTAQCLEVYHIHDAMVIYATFTNNDTKFASCGLDYRVNLTTIKGEKEISISVPGITVNEVLYSELYNILVVAAATNNTIIFYDLEKKEEKMKLQMNDVIVSCSLSKKDKGKYLLINSSKATPVLLLVSIENATIIRKFFGHRQERFTIKCNFGGCNENFIVCGSEDANAYVWHLSSSIPILVVKVHSSSVNSVIWPFHLVTGIILTCSDDHTINILSNEEVEKVYFNQGKQLENKMVNLEGNNIITSPRAQESANNSNNIFARFGNILRHIHYSSDDEMNSS